MSPLRKVLSRQNEEISADSEEVKPSHTLLYGKALILKLFRWKDQVLPGTRFSEGTQI